MTASSGTSSTTPQACDQPAGSDRSGEESTADPAVASLARAGLLNHAGVDFGISCRRRISDATARSLRARQGPETGSRQPDTWLR